MKIRGRSLILIASLLMTNPGFTSAGAATDDAGGGGAGGGGNQKKILMYLLRLGQYFGYNLDTDPKEQKKTISEELLAMTSDLIVKKEQFRQAFYELVGASPTVPVKPGDPGSAFVPKNNPYSAINQLANKTFPNYASPSDSAVSVSIYIDQPQSQADPVSQAVLDILGTPSASYCFNSDGTAWKGCSYISSGESIKNSSDITNYVIGAVGSKNGTDMMSAALPPRDTYFSYDYNKPLIGQLNSNTLLGPLMYDMEDNGASCPALPGGTGGTCLMAKNQAQQAANFIRYATNAVTPLVLPDPKDYDELYTMAKDPTPSVDRYRAQSLLSTYLASLRIYAAQSSVGIGNMYDMLAKRMPQDTQQQGQDGQQQSSTVALEEFKMATWRLFNPTKAQDQDPKSANWTDQLNTASPATVQKEIAVLLAEINYQMYLSRQQQERMLLTNSLLLMLNLQNAQPNLRTLLAKAKH
ncbi:MAG: type IV secretion protein IcmX [Legionella sp.]|nr:type IV secretion protein IcmX [Legionella sp.]